MFFMEILFFGWGKSFGFAPGARPELPKKATLSSAAPAHDTMDGRLVAKVAANCHSADLVLRSGFTRIGFRDVHVPSPPSVHA
jgi:hypothetical protein